MKVPQFRSFISNDDKKYIDQVFENNYIAEGPLCNRFLEQLKTIVGSEYGVLASNGTVALYLAMKALGIKPGDEVLVQNLSFIASANSVEMVGAKPVFVDIQGHNDLTIDLKQIKLNENTRAIVVAHLFGTVCSNIEEIVSFCKDNGLWLIEDAAQALAIRNDTTHCGLFGDVGTFSFYADKTITTAEGGLVVTKHGWVEERMTYLRNQGRKSSGTFVHPEIGYNFRMTDLQGALGLAQLEKLEEIKQRKVGIAERYTQNLGDRVGYLERRDDFNYIPFRVVAFVDNAEQTIRAMSEKDIEPRSMFYPFHRQPCYKHMELTADDFGQSDKCFEKGICLPTWVGMTDDMIDYTSEVLLKSLQR